MWVKKVQEKIRNTSWRQSKWNTSCHPLISPAVCHFIGPLLALPMCTTTALALFYVIVIDHSGGLNCYRNHSARQHYWPVARHGRVVRRKRVHNFIWAKWSCHETGFQDSQAQIRSRLGYLRVQFWLWPTELGQHYVSFYYLTITTTKARQHNGACDCFLI